MSAKTSDKIRARLKESRAAAQEYERLQAALSALEPVQRPRLALLRGPGEPETRRSLARAAAPTATRRCR